MESTLSIINSVVIVVLIIILPLFLKKYLPAYFNEKGKNLATKEDIKEITDKVESVKSNYAKDIEAFKRELDSLEKRKEIGAQVIDLINRYKELPKNASDDVMRDFEKEYYKLIPWIPSEILQILNNLFQEETEHRKRPDIKDVIIDVRKAILGNQCGDFKGMDLVHFVEYQCNIT